MVTGPGGCAQKILFCHHFCHHFLVTESKKLKQTEMLKFINILNLRVNFTE